MAASETVDVSFQSGTLPTVAENKQAELNMSTEGNYFCSVNLGKSNIRVILYFSEGNPLGHTLLERCRKADYDCGLVHNHYQVIDQLGKVRHHDQAVVVADTHSSMSTNLEDFKEYIYAHSLEHTVTLLAVLPDVENSTQMNGLLEAGVSRVLTAEDCRSDRFLWEMQLIEKSEVRLKQSLLFSTALFEAVEQSNDAIQITGHNSVILYVNHSFVDLNGYSKEEALGQPAMNILKYHDGKWENGPKAASAKLEQRWDGECMGRRKSGSALKQHLKLIPVQSSVDKVSHHVTIQRLLSSHDLEHSRLTSPRYSTSSSDGHVMRKQTSLSWIPRAPARMETPFSRVVQTLTAAKDNIECPPSIRESLERAMQDILSTSELYYPITENYRTRGSIVTGLLNTGRRFSVDLAPMRTYPHHHSRHTPITPPPPPVNEALKNIGKWDFDVLNLEAITHHEALYYVGMNIFKKFDLCEVLNVEDTVLASWLKLMERNYNHSNSYHDSTHAADVLQAIAYMINLLQDHLISQGDKLEPIELAALLITAVIHDLDHPGRTNPFLCNTRHEIAVLYNDNAVLENHHVAHSFKLTQASKEVNIYQNLDNTTYRNLRSSIIDLVLATDMAKHFEHLSKFTMSLMDDPGTCSSTSLNSKECRENRMVMKRIMVKCADVSNPCRPLKLSKMWTEKIAEEYFSQTEEEKARGLPVVFPDFDRLTCKIPANQVKFIDFFIVGMFEAWNNFCPVPVLMEQLSSNYEYWKSQYNSTSSSEEEVET